jgi:uncharacterized protein (DUF1778 family)
MPTSILGGWHYAIASHQILKEDLSYVKSLYTLDSQREFPMSDVESAKSADTARINLRTSADAKALIERAAAYVGTTVSAFMLQNAYESAKRVVAEHEVIQLTRRDFEQFAAALDKPPAPTTALKRLLRG